MSKLINIAKKSKLKNDYKGELDKTIKYIQDLYLLDEIPWVIGYSGGKDSTAVAQLTWEALKLLQLIH